VPGTRRDRAPAEEAGIRKAKPRVESAHEPQPLVRALHGERLCRSQAVAILGKEVNPLGQERQDLRGVFPFFRSCDDSIDANSTRKCTGHV
jgi:hypothetical protein